MFRNEDDPIIKVENPDEIGFEYDQDERVIRVGRCFFYAWMNIPKSTEQSADVDLNVLSLKQQLMP